MVYGSMYCPVSHLEIKDGDKCILLPLGFFIGSSFNKWNKANIGNFMYVYRFVGEPQEVVFNGNPNDVTYLDEHYKRVSEHQLYMLVHYEFYKRVVSEYEVSRIETVDVLDLFETVKPIWKKAKEMDLHAKTPQWIKELYTFAYFIDYLGLIPFPNNSVSQEDSTIKFYNSLRSDLLKK